MYGFDTFGFYNVTAASRARVSSSSTFAVSRGSSRRSKSHVRLRPVSLEETHVA